MITIYGQLYSSKNHRQLFKNKSTGKMFIAKPQKAKAAEDGLMVQLKTNKQRWRMMIALKEKLFSPDGYYPLRVQFKIYRKNNQRFDYVNIVQSLADQMVKAGYLPDDNADYFIPVFVPYEVDASNPRCEIQIL